MDKSCVLESKLCTVPEWEVKVSPVLNVPDISFTIVWTLNIGSGTVSYSNPESTIWKSSTPPMLLVVAISLVLLPPLVVTVTIGRAL